LSPLSEWLRWFNFLIRLAYQKLFYLVPEAQELHFVGRRFFIEATRVKLSVKGWITLHFKTMRVPFSL
jgi:hypothetical protein